MTNYKKSNASNTTETRNLDILSEKTGNIYETVSIISRRAVQLNKEIKEELLMKLEEFATPNESIDEIFENMMALLMNLVLNVLETLLYVNSLVCWGLENFGTRQCYRHGNV